MLLILDVLDKRNGGVPITAVEVFVRRGGAADGADEDDGEDPEHAEEDTDSASEDEGDCAALPRTQVEERVVEAGHERPARDGHEGAGRGGGGDVVVWAVVPMGLRDVLAPRITADERDGRPDEGKDLGLDVVPLATLVDLEVRVGVGVVVVGLNEGPSEGLAERVGDVDGFVSPGGHATCTWTTGSHSTAPAPARWTFMMVMVDPREVGLLDSGDRTTEAEARVGGDLSTLFNVRRGAGDDDESNWTCRRKGGGGQYSNRKVEFHAVG